jgi:hypothetical protein
MVGIVLGAADAGHRRGRADIDRRLLSNISTPTDVSARCTMPTITPGLGADGSQENLRRRQVFSDFLHQHQAMPSRLAVLGDLPRRARSQNHVAL